MSSRGHDLIGHQYTWKRSTGTADLIETRLDRAMTSKEWLHIFPLAKLYNLDGAPSDHRPFQLEPNLKTRNCGSKKRFRFENAWLTEPLCRQLVKDEWENNNSIGVQEKIKQCGEKLEAWGTELTDNFGRRIKACKMELKQLRS